MARATITLQFNGVLVGSTFLFGFLVTDIGYI